MWKIESTWELGNTWKGMMKSVKNFKDKCYLYYTKAGDHFILRGIWQSQKLLKSYNLVNRWLIALAFYSLELKDLLKALEL